MGIYTVKNQTLTAFKIVSFIDSTVTLNDGTSHVLPIGVSFSVGDYVTLGIDGSLIILPKSFFESEYIPLLSFSEAITALLAGNSVTRLDSGVVIKPTDDTWTFSITDRSATDYEVVVA